jgi:hypothetical protein
VSLRGGNFARREGLQGIQGSGHGHGTGPDPEIAVSGEFNLEFNFFALHRHATNRAVGAGAWLATAGPLQPPHRKLAESRDIAYPPPVRNPLHRQGSPASLALLPSARPLSNASSKPTVIPRQDPAMKGETARHTCSQPLVLEAARPCSMRDATRFRRIRSSAHLAVRSAVRPASSLWTVGRRPNKSRGGSLDTAPGSRGGGRPGGAPPGGPGIQASEQGGARICGVAPDPAQGCRICGLAPDLRVGAGLAHSRRDLRGSAGSAPLVPEGVTTTRGGCLVHERCNAIAPARLGPRRAWADADRRAEVRRVVRGGSWLFATPDLARCASRYSFRLGLRNRLIGFRLVRGFPT